MCRGRCPLGVARFPHMGHPRAGIDRVEWHFFPNANGTIGPDRVLLDLLTANNIPFTIWVP